MARVKGQIVMLESDSRPVTLLRAELSRYRVAAVATEVELRARLASRRYAPPLVIVINVDLLEEPIFERLAALIHRAGHIPVVATHPDWSMQFARDAARTRAADVLPYPVRGASLEYLLPGRRKPRVEGPRLPTLAEAEWEYIQLVLKRHGGKRRPTASELEIDLRTLQRRIAKGAPPPRQKA
jgi:DNA-binding NtrC family response regulator